MTHSQPPDLRGFLANLTTEPGIYRMLDAHGQVLYVGKATNLKKRVSSYFSRPDSSAKTRSLVSQIASVEVSITRSETEALLLESSLIKSLRPKYNVLMRDDKSYPFIYLSRSHPFPSLTVMRSKKKPTQGVCFGPYPSASAVRETLNTIQKVFKIRNCSDSYFSSRSRPCLQYQINRCTAPCTAYISEEAYRNNVEQAVRLLQGKCRDIVETLATQMEKAASCLAFEEAAVLRDQIKKLRLIQEEQGMVQKNGDADVIAIEARPGFACIQCVTVRDGQVLSSQRFFPTVPKQTLEEAMQPADLQQQVLHAFVAHYYLEMPGRIPALIIVDCALEHSLALANTLSELRGKSCRIQSNPHGAKAAWLAFARDNLRLSVEEYTTSNTLLQLRYKALHELLGLSKPVTRMECFDISHTQGQETIASCVVFDAQGPCKSAYRKFNITGITPGDDYAAMEQAITRRFKRALLDQNLPEILIIDGGKGQVSVAQRVLLALGVEHVCLLGIAKGPDRKPGWEHLIFKGREITVPPDSKALHLLQHIRDEAHRFAITAHRKKRQKASLQSSLESIPGIGAKRRQALLREFGGIRELSKAPIHAIAKVPGISHDLATRIYQYFH